MLLSDTLDDMLAAAPRAQRFAVIGPSAGLWPGWRTLTGMGETDDMARPARKPPKKKRPEGRLRRDRSGDQAATPLAVSTYSSIWSKFKYL